MRKRRIRTDWASLSLSPDGHPVVCLKSNGVPQCLCFDSREQLKQALDSNRLSVRRWVLSVSKELCIVKPLCLPAGDLDEAMQMVEFELPSLIPLTPEEVTYGCTLTGRRDGQKNILVWILRRDLLQQYLAPLRMIGITPKVVLPDSLAIHGWFAARRAPHAETLAVQMFVGERATTILVCQADCLQGVFQHSLLDGIPETAPDASVEISMLRQEDLLGSVAAEGHLVISGDADRLSRVAEPIRRFTDACHRDLVMLEAPRAISYSQNGAPERACVGFGYETVVVEGLLHLLSQPDTAKANLLPHQHASRYHQRAALLLGLRAVVPLGLLVLLLWGWLVVGTWRLQRESRAIQAEMAPIRHLAQGVESKRQRLDAIRRQYARRGQIGRLFREIYECTPATISFYELRVDARPEGLSVGLNGQADLLPTALEYTNDVRDAELLGGLQIINAQQIPQVGGGSVVEFKATCLIQGVPK